MMGHQAADKDWVGLLTSDETIFSFITNEVLSFWVAVYIYFIGCHCVLVLHNIASVLFCHSILEYFFRVEW